jgi:Putative transposase of IS4/5 family (DUF4096)
MTARWEVSDEQWALLEPVLRPRHRADGRGRPWRDARHVLNGVLWVLGTGAQWRELARQVSALSDLPSAISAMGSQWQTGSHKRHPLLIELTCGVP